MFATPNVSQRPFGKMTISRQPYTFSSTPEVDKYFSFGHPSTTLNNQSIAICFPQKTMPKSKRPFNDNQIADMQRSLFNEQNILSISNNRPVNKKIHFETAKSTIPSAQTISTPSTLSIHSLSSLGSPEDLSENDSEFNPINSNQEVDFRLEKLVLDFSAIEREENQINDQLCAQGEKRNGDGDLPFNLETEESVREFAEFVASVGRRKGGDKKEEDVEEAHDEQNEKRNLGGLIVMRVLNGIKKVLKGKHSIEVEYIERTFSQQKFIITLTSKSEFSAFLKKFSAKKTADGKIVSKKTYKWVRDNISKEDVYYANLLKECVEAFLSEKGARAFNLWIDGSRKMGETTKGCLREEQEKKNFRKKFQEQVWNHVCL